MIATEQERTVLDFLPQIQKALDLGGNTHTVQDVADAVLSGHAQLWTAGDGLVVTQVQDHPQGRELVFWIAAGSLEDVLDLAPGIYEWGREIGCVMATFTGRRGWARPLVEHGWKVNQEMVIYQKDLWA